MSEARLRHIENGYERRGKGEEAIDVPARPSPAFIVKLARALGIPRSEALAMDGHPVDAIPDDPTDVPPQRIWDNWTLMTPNQKKCMEWMAALMVDPHAAYKGDRPSSSRSPVFVPPTETTTHTRIRT